MKDVQFKLLSNVDLNALLIILNKTKIRTHLVEHDHFDMHSLSEWVDEKVRIDQLPGCCIRAVIVEQNLAGWCGIQPDKEGYELAIVLDDQYWGAGLQIFKNLMQWAKEYGHTSVLIHLLETRKKYKFLESIATKIKCTPMLGNNFITYELAVGNNFKGQSSKKT